MIEWFEDLFVGMHFKSGTSQIRGDEIKEFASKFDPQPFHLDDAARKTMFRGLAASGWHSSALAMRLGIGARPCGPHPLIGRIRRFPSRPICSDAGDRAALPARKRAMRW